MKRTISIVLLLGAFLVAGCTAQTPATPAKTSTGEQKSYYAPVVDEATFKAQCKGVEFRVLDKNPESLKGTKYCTTGKVIQIMEGATETNFRMDVTQGEYGYWDDTIYASHMGKMPGIYEDSIINIWGEVMGSYTYESVAGYSITLPLVYVRFYEVVTP